MSVASEESSGADDQPTMPLVSAGSSDSCIGCGAHLAPDQRYCVECGTRRGASRFQLAGSASSQPQGGTYASQPVGGVGGRGPRFNSSIMLLATVFVVLLAVGVGVLIGHNNSPKPAKAAPISVVVNGGGSGGSTAGSTAGSTPSTGATASSGSTSKSAGTKSTKKASKATTKAAAATNPNAAAKGKAGAAAAAKSFNKSATNKSALGAKCTAGTPGCSKSGKQTGNLF